MPLSVALLHHPVRDRLGKIVATNITNFDVHDIARACRTYGVNDYYLVHPSEEQLMFVSRLKDHWTTGYGRSFNPKRYEALKVVQTAPSLDEVVRRIEVRGATCNVVVTTARESITTLPLITFSELRGLVMSSELGEKDELRATHYLLVFGTGFGLADEVFEKAWRRLEPLKGSHMSQFRHLSVRSAASICLDRLLSS